MADTSWRHLEIWERVKWARSRHYGSATAAAQALGMLQGTYRCYERGPDSAKFIKLDYDHARQFAREFKVRWEWLLDGVGEPWLTPQRDAQPETSEPPNQLRAWREYRSLTPGALAKRAGTTAQIVTDLETGAAELSDKWARKLAPALDTRAGFLLDVDPNDADPAFFDTVSAIPKERRAEALEVLRIFSRSSRPR